ncbi:hypothetical protein ECHHL_0231 [Ehrlichia chaffeensis str. Heartland]|uniref:Uncharacterized protein n=1 Tax=Ehrlichia chaffeensis (strain ATCC CRL-10679 / Arkansas) TaxID=205920 RepID=Q2GHI3_EHRCR|nr:hypothetical protein [Ehrlichia chaffeensis]AHX03397.1 hypothetical protein ECHHL_0231 [Ehrlichia chaffeensis str. Heartland]ABD44664.1 hypothetical protein ECH_0279 [Ehrlichia chaffeensis str. Arkansas]AHX05882.1 hypothetical protein ECHJAX_0826 [Ehrlichia chaffeensis str. Jax]AHX06873.1 hypothetical protein ECHLIB_0829 [Ehrlichia chaffeensis str. Liberty]AHX07589.1 hypothetical protein ECHOSC_0240 [Ehrlichia chaffeensis str. Osceola]
MYCRNNSESGSGQCGMVNVTESAYTNFAEQGLALSEDILLI